MKILIYRYNSIYEPDVLDAFKTLGHTVVEIRDEMENKNITPKETVTIVSNRLQNEPVDMVFSINFYPAISEVCNIFHIPYLSWTVDSPVLELYATSITNDYNRIFLFDMSQYQEIRQLNPTRTFYLPLGTNVKAKQDAIAACRDYKKYQCDVSFVGSLYVEKSPYDKVVGLSEYSKGYLDGIIKAQQKIFGYYFVEELIPEAIVEEFAEKCPSFYRFPADSYLDDRKTLAQLYIGNKIAAVERTENLKLLSERYGVDLYTGSDTSRLPMVNNRGFAKSLTEMPVIFNKSKVNLNMTVRGIRSGIPLRVWDVLGCQGFLISNYQEEIAQWLKIGEEIVTYGSQEELVELVGYYLDHDREREEIARNGYEKVKNNHTIFHRIETMLEMAGVR